MPVGRKVAGRKKGTPNKSTAQIRELAQLYAADAIKGIAALAANPKTAEATRLAAWKELLDRGYGKAPQTIAGDPTAPLLHEIRHIIVDPKR